MYNGIVKSGVGIGRNREIYYLTGDFTSTDTSEISNVNKVSLYLANERNTLNNKQFASDGTHRVSSIRVGYGHEEYIPGSSSTEQINIDNNYYWISARFENIGYMRPLIG